MAENISQSLILDKSRGSRIINDDNKSAMTKAIPSITNFNLDGKSAFANDSTSSLKNTD